MINLWLFLAKYAFLFSLYVFLFWAVRVMAAEARFTSTAAAPATGASKLEIFSKDVDRRTMALTRTLTIGRLPDNDIVLDDNAVSGHHARIVRRGGDWALEDLGSSNGTFLNGVRLADRNILDDGDVIKVGWTKIKTHMDGKA